MVRILQMDPFWKLLLSILSLQLATMAVAQDTSSVLAEAAKSTTSASPSTIASTTTASASSTTSAKPQTHTISVGNGDHKFRPDVTQAQVGDTIEFDFYPANHSVVRAEYQFPCIPYEMTGSDKQGFFSGFHPVDAVLDKPPKYTLKINDTSPIFFYCSAPGSCIDFGMVGVINPNATTSLETQRQLALKSAYMLQPGESFPAESPLPSNLPSSTNMPSSIPSAPASQHSSKLSSGAIAGIVVGCIGVVVLAALLFFFWGRSKSLKEEIFRNNSTIVRNVEPRSPVFYHSPSSQHTPYAHPSHPLPITHHQHTSPANGIPPAYYAPNPAASPPPGVSDGRVSRAASHRSVGGTFDLSPTTGYYTRTHEGQDSYKYTAPHTSDMTSPVDPKIVPVGPYARQMQELQRLNRSPNSEHSVPPGYFESATGRPRTYHLNSGQEPVEIDGTSVLPKFI